VRAGAGFDADQARRSLGKEIDDLRPAQRLSDDRYAVKINAVNLENRFGNIAAGTNDFHGTPPWLARCRHGCDTISFPLDGRESPFH
jgi:hypothetical protein